MSQPAPLSDTELDPDLLNDPEVQAWFEKHLTDLRQDAYGPLILYSVLAAAFAVGLAAYVAGYLLKSTATTEPLGLLADLLYTFGFALWTAAVVVVLVELIPEAKRRQIRRALEQYEAIRRDKPSPKDLR
jgi:F0F1-type ATP synthase assembly protein I